jgi:large subunit ribosomal protein L15
MELNTIKPGAGAKHAKRRVAEASVRAWARPRVAVTRARSRVPVASTRWASKAVRCRLQRRLPKRGFKSAQLKYNGEVTLSDLQRLAADEVDLLTLKAAGLVRRPGQVRQGDQGR